MPKVLEVNFGLYLISKWSYHFSPGPQRATAECPICSCWAAKASLQGPRDVPAQLLQPQPWMEVRVDTNFTEIFKSFLCVDNSNRLFKPGFLLEVRQGYQDSKNIATPHSCIKSSSLSQTFFPIFCKLALPAGCLK